MDEALDCLFKEDVLKIGICYALPEVFLAFLNCDKLDLTDDILLSQNGDGDTIVHQICKNPQIGLDVF